jgi:3-oxoadipate enol-lactonase
MLNSVESDSVYSLIDFNQLAEFVSVIRYNVCNKSVSGDYCWDSSTKELIRIADDQKYDSMILAGASMGSGTAIHTAVRFPERVKALILVTPPPAWEMRRGVKTIYTKIAKKIDQHPELIKRLISINPDPPEFFEQKHPGTRQQLLNFRLSFHPRYYSNIYLGGAVSDLPPREQIAVINVPTFIVAHLGDENHPFEMACELNSLIKGSELYTVSDYKDYKKLQKKLKDFIDMATINNKS